MSRGVYRIAHYPVDRLGQYREAVLSAQASLHGPERIALSNDTALLLYGISDLNPSQVHLTVPKSARLRRERPEWITIHNADLIKREVAQRQGIPVTTISRSIMDVLSTTHRADVARQAITDALRDGLLSSPQATGLRKMIRSTTQSLPLSTQGIKGTSPDCGLQASASTR